MAIINFQLSIDVENGTFEITSMETGETKTVSIPKVSKSKKTTTKSAVNDNSAPKVVLEDNKYVMNQAAADLMGIAPDDKIELKFIKEGRKLTPALVPSDKGNRVTKSLSVSCRGSNHVELVKFGTEFTLIKAKEGVFTLQGNKEPETLDGDENISIPEEDTNSLIDEASSDLDELLSEDTEDSVDAFDFTL